MIEIDVDPPDDESRRLWSSLGNLVALLPADWVLIGGLMVQLHALEWNVDDVRATSDIDVLGQARPQGALAAIDLALQLDGFTPLARRRWLRPSLCPRRARGRCRGAGRPGAAT